MKHRRKDRRQAVRRGKISESPFQEILPAPFTSS
nr:MAG TPA: hypothetical protein [Caudoviricetes sp.]